MSKSIKVSVCVVSYNQVRYISKCLQSLVDQVVDFDYEVIVGDDASTDGTREVIESYCEKYPKLIRGIFNDNNKGPAANVFSVYKSAVGEFISHMDGDDYALPGKLKAQVSSLESNPSCVICSHDVEIVNSSGEHVRGSYRRYPSGVHGLMSLYAQLPFFAHSSKMFVNKFGSDFWGQFNSNALDIEVHVAQARVGGIVHIDEVLGGYRISTGISSVKKGVSNIIFEGCSRVFCSALNDPSLDHTKIRSFYSASLFRFAYQSAVFGDAEKASFFLKQAYEYTDDYIRRTIYYFLSTPPMTKVFLIVSQFRAKARGFLRS